MFDKLARMELLDALDTYFRGERALGLAFVPVGLGLWAIAFASWRTYPGAFGLSIAVPLLLVGLGMAAGGAILAIKTERQIVALHAAHAEDAGAMIAGEIERMERVNANWPRVKIFWSLLSLAAAGLILFGGRDWTSGIGLSLITAAAILFWVDVTAERRAVPYTEALAEAHAASGEPD